MSRVLQARGVGVRYRGARGVVVRAVDDVSLTLEAGEALGIVGESGCGKSTLARCLVRQQRPDEGSILLQGTDIAQASSRALQPLRAHMQMIFQDSAASLNPRRSVAASLAAPLRAQGVSARDAGARVAELLTLVGLPGDAGQRLPHAFSGGQRQRINIARALALKPALVVADEPVAALDVSIQAQIVNLLADLRAQLGLALVFVSHDLAVVRQLCDRIAVMYLGEIVEEGPSDALLARPHHPYTRALREAVPRRGAPLGGLQGDPPNPASLPSGCRFHPRCPVAQARCATERPSLGAVEDGRAVACHFPLG